MAAEPWCPLCPISHGGQRYLCLYRIQPGNNIRIHVTNGNEVWRTDPIEEALEEWDAVRNVTSHELVDKLREKFQNSSPGLEMQGSIASMSFQVDSKKVSLDLLKLPVSEARAQVQEVLFDLSDRVTSLEVLLKDKEGISATSLSPVKQSQKNQMLLIPDVSARRRGNGGSSAQVKKRLPGESIINPGCKRLHSGLGLSGSGQ
ncbi:protein PAXX isoform X2 [Hyla sarda]|uniref:protein PAXX isoform X2 n=1 Tax=Hyla sarda TaxID=327740 RepID=UPI0024C35C57|nr:protein PAXX isoform X2 [Hyla sarda]